LIKQLLKSNNSLTGLLEVSDESPLWLFLLQSSDTGSALLFWNTSSADELLFGAHSSVDINVTNLDIQRTMGWNLEPGVDLPDEVQDNEERSGQIGLEEDGRIEIGSSNWVEGDVELGDEAHQVQNSAEVRTPNTELSLERKLVNMMALIFPETKLARSNRNSNNLTMRNGNEYGQQQYCQR
jgi:hypothetical protein